MKQRPELKRYTRLSHSVTSLAIEAEHIDLVRMRDIMLHLPNLNDLILSGTATMGPSLGLGTGLRGRFGGELQLRDKYTVSEKLLEVPTGLHFTKIYIYVDFPCLLQTVRLAEAYRKTLSSTCRIRVPRIPVNLIPSDPPASLVLASVR